jgi:chemotaxis protein histidine kinase CheA
MRDTYLRGEFFKESLRNISLMKEELKKIKVETNKTQAIERLFHSVHMLKGSAGFIGFNSLQLLAHRVEDHLEKLRISTEKNNSGHFNQLTCAIDNCSNLLDRLYKNEKHFLVQHEALSLEMSYTLSAYFQQISKYIKKLARELKKEIVLNYKVPEEIKFNQHLLIDDLNHVILLIINNACSHGIERGKERLILGKDIAGKIEISLFISNQLFHIELRDDGAGVSLDEIKKSALTNEVSTEFELNQLSRSETFNLLFKPGFTLSSEINPISGRGFGMDIIKTKLEAIAGTVSFESEKNLGSKYCIAVKLEKYI